MNEKNKEFSDNEFGTYLDKKKVELRKLKDSDFVATHVDVSPTIAGVINKSMDMISKNHEMDIMEVGAASMSYGLDALEKIIKNKGEEYAKSIIQDMMDANAKGDFKRMLEIADQMKIDAEEKSNTEERIRNVIKDEDDKGISLEQYVKKYGHMLKKEFESIKEEDFTIIKARNPENPEDIIELDLHKTHIEELKMMGSELDMSFEEVAYMVTMCTMEASEDVPIELKQEIRKFLDRQNKRISDNVHRELEYALENITVGQLKDILRKFHSIPMIKLDTMERSLRKEFNTNKLSGQYKDIETYVKIKLASIIQDEG